MKVSELFDTILERPALYVGKPSVPHICTFLEGYIFGRAESNPDVRDKLYAGFNTWVAKRFNIQTAHNWSSIITFMGQSELGAFELLKELWTEYKENKQNQIE